MARRNAAPIPFRALLVRLPIARSLALGATPLTLGGGEFELEPLYPEHMSGRLGVAAGGSHVWHVASPKGATDGEHAWEMAHRALGSGLGMAGDDDIFIEPDLIQSFMVSGEDEASPLGVADACDFQDQDDQLPYVGGRFAWHLDGDKSELRAARERAGAAPASGRIRIAHLDTGYDPTHKARPLHVANEHNFVKGENEHDAHDPGHGGILKHPGHGTGTLGILAGGPYALNSNGYQFDAALGGAPECEVVPVRVADSVVQIMTSGVAQGFDYAVQLCGDEATRVHVLSMSMGGVASKAWADAVNRAYDNGIVVVTAAGNNISARLFGVPSRFVVYPARFRRVIAACGVMADRKPYYGLPFKVMQGNYGPASKMATAISAFTPNLPWAHRGCRDLVRMNGAGTSSATPQVAAAAALYMHMHAASLLDRTQYPEPWMRVEAVRHALFRAADKRAEGGNLEKLGNGVLQAAKALAVMPLAAGSLQRTPADDAGFAFLKALTGFGMVATPQARMLALEATQLAQTWPYRDVPNPFEESVPDPDLPAEAIPVEQKKRYLEALLEHPNISEPLYAHVEQVRREHFGGGARGSAPAPKPKPADAPAPPPQWRRGVAFTPPEPPYRRLRGFSLDPSLTTELATAPYSITAFQVPWEPLQPGPVGEYLEVVDVDPPSVCAYEPVDLEDPRLLAQDGLPPSEGTPQFHQQMTYAVASLTIHNFERALGRRVLWRPGPPPDAARPRDDGHFVQRLRIHPHALRERNAYYSPARVALLFGYFNPPADIEGALPGPMVFTCLSHDIVAHETTHAILDGMHRRFMEPTNPDVYAFHEAFSDLVALFQHFTLPDVVREQIARTRGSIRGHENLLGQLARQFGSSTGRGGALRDAIGRIVGDHWEPRHPDPTDYASTSEPHERGAILVAAVFDAFMSIYERRTADLVRLATGGTGVLGDGEIHPDLVARLADEAAKASRHVLGMCIRALDYVPPVDITFGEYLRAILTADADLVRNDTLLYRVAFLEAFRRRGIQPRDVRTLSVESLLWRTPENDGMQPSEALQSYLGGLRGRAGEFLFAESLGGAGVARQDLFLLQRSMRREVHGWLKQHFAESPDGAGDAAFLGLEPDSDASDDRIGGLEVHAVRFATRVGPDGDVVPQVLVTLLQQRRIAVDPAQPNGATMPFEGGCTVVVDLRRQRIRYAIRKNLSSSVRMGRQQSFASTEGGSLRATYLGEAPGQRVGEPFARLHLGH
ncbi:MAG: S8 family serine peptidase [Candidatus Eisenbacteria bacterium]